MEYTGALGIKALLIVMLLKFPLIFGFIANQLKSVSWFISYLAIAIIIVSELIFGKVSPIGYIIGNGAISSIEKMEKRLCKKIKIWSKAPNGSECWFLASQSRVYKKTKK